MPIIISPSILSADFANLERDIRRVEDAGADWLHIDVMDGHFVPNITIGVPVVKSIRKITKLPLDVHLMIENPEKYIEPFAASGADIITFHYEAVMEAARQLSSYAAKLDNGEITQEQQGDKDLSPYRPIVLSPDNSIFQIISTIHSFGIKAGMSIKPKTPAEVVFPYLNDLDMVLVMTVEPGFGGQKFMEDCAEKVKIIKEYRSVIARTNEVRTSQSHYNKDNEITTSKPSVSPRNDNLIIQVDGGINAETAKICTSYGANCLVAGNYIYKSDDIEQAIKSLK